LYDSTEGIGRVESGTETENDSGDKVEQFSRSSCLQDVGKMREQDAEALPKPTPLIYKIFSHAGNKPAFFVFTVNDSTS